MMLCTFSVRGRFSEIILQIFSTKSARHGSEYLGRALRVVESTSAKRPWDPDYAEKKVPGDAWRSVGFAEVA